MGFSVRAASPRHTLDAAFVTSHKKYYVNFDRRFCCNRQSGDYPALDHHCLSKDFRIA